MKNNKYMTNILDKEECIGKQSVLAVSERIIKDDFPVHSHDFFEIELIVSGSGHHRLNGVDRKVNSGSVYLLTPDDVHALIPDEPIKLFNVMFSEELFSDRLAFETLTTSYGLQIQLENNAAADLIALFRNLLKESRAITDSYHISYMSGILQCILITILRASHQSEPVSSSDSSLRGVLFYIQRHFREALTLSGMAQYAHFSTTYFCRIFKDKTGKGFSEYLNDIRVRYAYRLIVSSDISITDACFQSGFTSFPTFAREFKKRYSQSPITVRKTVSR